MTWAGRASYTGFSFATYLRQAASLLNGLPLASDRLCQPPLVHCSAVVGDSGATQSFALVAPVVDVVVPAGQAVAAVAPIVETYEPIGAEMQLDWPVLGW